MQIKLQTDIFKSKINDSKPIVNKKGETTHMSLNPPALQKYIASEISAFENEDYSQKYCSVSVEIVEIHNHENKPSQLRGVDRITLATRIHENNGSAFQTREHDLVIMIY